MKNLIALCLIAFVTISLSSCSKSDDHKPNSMAKDNFEKMYPQASSIKWSNKQNHYVVEFYLNNKESKAWYDGAGVWKLTETEIPLIALPEAIKKSFDGSIYSKWIIEEIDFIERFGHEPFYVLEIELGDQEYDLYYLANGTLIKAFADNNKENNYLPKQLPDLALTYMDTKHPGYKLIDVDFEKNYIEVEFLENTIKKEVLFSLDGKWLQTTTDITLSAVPNEILNQLKNSPYGSYKIDDIEYVEKPTGSYYEFELESKNKDIDLRIYLDGRMEVVA